MSLDKNAPHFLHGFNNGITTWNTIKSGSRFLEKGMEKNADFREILFDTEELKESKSRPLTPEEVQQVIGEIGQVSRAQINAILDILSKVPTNIGHDVTAKLLKCQGIVLKPSTFEEQADELIKLYGSGRSYEDATIFTAHASVTNETELGDPIKIADQGPVKVQIGQKVVSSIDASFPIAASTQKRLIRSDRPYFYGPVIEGDTAFHSFAVDAFPQAVEVAKMAYKFMGR